METRTPAEVRISPDTLYYCSSLSTDGYLSDKMVVNVDECTAQLSNFN